MAAVEGGERVSDPMQTDYDRHQELERQYRASLKGAMAATHPVARSMHTTHTANEVMDVMAGKRDPTLSEWLDRNREGARKLAYATAALLGLGLAVWVEEMGVVG